MRRPLPWLASLLLLVLLAACSTGDQALSHDGDLTALSTSDRFIVVLNDTPAPDRADAVRADAAAFARGLGLVPNRAYGAALVGFAAHMTPQRAAALANNPRVAYVETDDPVELYVQTIPTGIDRILATGNTNLDIDSTDDYRVDVDVAVIDTGVDFEHPDLNVAGGVDCTVTSGGGPPWARESYCSSTEGTGGDDDHYHGTHVAGTIGALDNGIGVVGVAPGARIWAVKVLDSQGSGYESGIVAGIDWITANTATIEVANMSLGGSGYSQAEYDAIQGAVDAGIAFAVAAGNDNDDANNYSPASFDNVLTVSALADFDGAAGGNGTPSCRTDQDDTLADFSNWGPAVDLAAPGVCIVSTYPIEQGEYGTISGTSMASPHAAGALALLASAINPTNASDVQNLYNQVLGSGNFDWTDDSGDDVVEPLLDVSGFSANLISAGDGSGGASNDKPIADFSFTRDGLSVAFTDQSSDDGKLTSWLWDFGDNTEGSTVQNPSHTFVAGTYQVTLTVTDNDGATATASQDVTVGEPTAALNLTVTTSKIRGVKHAALAWNSEDHLTYVVSWTTDWGGDGSSDPISGGSFEHSTGDKGGGSATYQVCDAGTNTCSNAVTATW